MIVVRLPEGFGFLGSIDGQPVYPLTARLRSKVKPRKCLSCGRSFLSPGPGFRTCSTCRDVLHLNLDEDPDQSRPRVVIKGGLSSLPSEGRIILDESEPVNNCD